jgi:hypothetical protein
VSDSPRTVSGKWMILSVFGVGIAMAVAAWTFYYLQQRGPLKFWGSSVALLIKNAPTVEAWRLVDAEEPAGDSKEVEIISVGSQRLRIAERKDVSKAPGMSHLRNGFLYDRCFAWDQPAPQEAWSWQYALRFSDGKSEATVLLAPQAQRIKFLENGQEVSNAPVAQGYEGFFQEHFPAN